MSSLCHIYALFSLLSHSIKPPDTVVNLLAYKNTCRNRVLSLLAGIYTYRKAVVNLLASIYTCRNGVVNLLAGIYTYRKVVVNLPTGIYTCRNTVVNSIYPSDGLFYALVTNIFHPIS